jgi:hypothetical protein
VRLRDIDLSLRPLLLVIRTSLMSGIVEIDVDASRHGHKLNIFVRVSFRVVGNNIRFHQFEGQNSK